MYNYELLKEVGKLKTPVILKRGLSATYNEWLLAAEYIKNEGNENIILCERGIRGFDPTTRNILDEKMFGVFKHKVMNRKIPLVRGFDDYFYAPHSRHTEIRKEDILAHDELTILAESEEAGVFLLMNQDGSQIFVMGHPEYDRTSLTLTKFRL